MMNQPLLPEPQVNRLKPPVAASQIGVAGLGWVVCAVVFVVSYTALRQFSYTPPSFGDYSPTTDYHLGYLTFYVLAMLSLGSFVSTVGLTFALISLLVQQIRKHNLTIRCPVCTTRNPVKKYLQGQGCKSCGSLLVYCERCGKPVAFKDFVWGAGCPHCSYQYFHTTQIKSPQIGELMTPLESSLVDHSRPDEYRRDEK